MRLGRPGAIGAPYVPPPPPAPPIELVVHRRPEQAVALGEEVTLYVELDPEPVGLTAEVRSPTGASVRAIREGNHLRFTLEEPGVWTVSVRSFSPSGAATFPVPVAGTKLG